MKTELHNKIHCDYCGRFISPKDLEDGSATQINFISDSKFSTEESGWICPKCSEEEEKFYWNGNKN